VAGKWYSNWVRGLRNQIVKGKDKGNSNQNNILWERCVYFLVKDNGIFRAAQQKHNFVQS